MNKVASPKELVEQLNTLIAKIGSSTKLSRAEIAEELRQLSHAVAGERQVAAAEFKGVKYKGKYLLAADDDEFHLEGNGAKVVLHGSLESGWSGFFEQDNEANLKKPSRPSVHGKNAEEVIDEVLTNEKNRIQGLMKFLEEQDRAVKSVR